MPRPDIDCWRLEWLLRRLRDRVRLVWWRLTRQKGKLKGWEIYRRKFGL